MEIPKLLLTALFSAVTLFMIAKIMGHKQVGQLDFFDHITGITIGSIAAEMATELEDPWKPFLAMIVYGGVSVLLSWITNKFSRMRKYINGTPTIILDGGKLYRNNMKKAKLDLSEFMVLCRQQGYFDLNDIETAVFEYNGKLSVLPTALKRPVTPDDMGLKPAAAHISTEVIMDGQVLHNNLKRMGLDILWLKKEVKAQGCRSTDQVFLGICDENHTLTLFKDAS